MLFIAGFHVGFPLCLCRTNKKAGWPPIRELLAEAFRSHKDYNVIDEIISAGHKKTEERNILKEIKPETNIPLGWPLRIEHSRFNEIFSINTFFEKEKFDHKQTNFDLKSEIWICPTGTVVLIGRITCTDEEAPLTLNYFSDTVENHYAELSYIYTCVVDIILKCIKDNEIKNVPLNKEERIILENCISLSNSINVDKYNPFKDEVSKSTFESILIDVYYIELSNDHKEKNIIKYVDSTIFNDPTTSVYIIISYLSFLNMRWLTQYLSEQTRILHEDIENISIGAYNNSKLYEIKYFRVFCLRLLNEMRPMSIRLTRKYMEAMEIFWNNSRMEKDVELINSQLETIENIFEWIDTTKKQILEDKIKNIAFIVTTISLLAVVAQIISTIDFQEFTIDKLGRFILIFGVTALFSSAIFLYFRKK